MTGKPARLRAAAAAGTGDRPPRCQIVQHPAERARHHERGRGQRQHRQTGLQRGQPQLLLQPQRQQ
ncbi:hypothetical protein [Nocardia sp. BMG51109]|uniref:hypothetical protein n=1 Tax=Nocardia sp. BMG51109 TaxID=1056816 RepID=UPI0004636E0D|nr:hypothetical protein [Nocardia sp. BMG51109]